MDGHRFDGLARALSSGLSRRQTLTVLGAALSGSGLLAALPEEATALSRRKRRRCKRSGGTVCSAGTRKSECCATTDGNGGAGFCVNGACSCLAYTDGSYPPPPNGCPTQANGQECTCYWHWESVSLDGACGGGCSTTTCDTNDDCPPGSVCSPDCGPFGSNEYRCTNPCIPG